VSDLAQIVKIRTVKNQVTEAEHIQVTHSVTVAKAEKERQKEQVNLALDAWERSLSSPFDPTATSAWGQEINSATVIFEEVSEHVISCENRLLLVKGELINAIASESCATQLYRDADRKYLAVTENAQLAEFSDQVTRARLAR
jgi:hypothetical protein